MTAEVVNLRRARKARARAERAGAVAASRVLHGRSRAQKEIAAIEASRAERLIEGHRLEREPDEADLRGDGA